MHLWHSTALVACLSTLLSAQTEPTTLKAEAVSAIVWDETSPSTSSSEIFDPITGVPIHRLHHAGVEVSSMAAFEIIRSGTAGEFLAFTVVVANNSARDLVVSKAGVVIDGRFMLPLAPFSMQSNPKGKLHETAVRFPASQCLQSASFQSSESLEASTTSTPITVTASTARVLTFATKDPRPYSLLCSVKGCFPKGVMRFYITVNSTDYVFVWPGQSLTPCGK